MTKRQLVSKTTTDDLRLVAEAAEKGATIKHFNAKDIKKIKRTVRLIRKVQAAQ